MNECLFRSHAVGTALWCCHSLMVGLVYHNDEDVLLTFISTLPIFDTFVAEVDLITHSWIFKQNVVDRSKLKIKVHNFKTKKTNKD